MARRVVLLLLEAAAISVPLTWLWIEWGRDLYPHLLGPVVEALLPMLGLPALRPNLLPDRFVSFVPFLVLMLVTPRMGARRRAGGTLAGFALIFASHVAFVVWALAIQETETLRQRPFRNIFPALIVLDAFPIALWAIFARDFLRELAFRAPTDSRRSGVGS